MATEILSFYLLGLGFALPLLGYFAFKKNVSMTTRGWTVLGLLHLITAIFWGGTFTCTGFALLLAAWGGYELLGTRFQNPLRAVLSALLAIAAWGLSGVSAAFWLPLWGAAIVLTFALPKTLLATRSWLLFFALAIIATGCSALLAMAEPVPTGWIAVVLLAQVNDTCALLAGKKMGKRKIFSKISPNKTAEGFLGGLLGLLAALLFLTFTLPELHGIPWYTFAGIAVLMWWTINAGDLLFSALKRSQDLKDFSRLLPGHGGILDRFDSILLAAPAWLALSHWLL